ncbi:phosphopyruvate hydratase [Patescibacteria group bacterium]
MKDKIKTIFAYEILDSRGNPTVACDITTKKGITATAMVPSGASTGVHEAIELRDGDETRYGGKGVLIACQNVNETLAPDIQGMAVDEQKLLDKKLLALDGTKNKSSLGANALLSVSLAAAHAAAKSAELPLYRYLADRPSYEMPLPLFNVINGGAHADNNLSVQEYKIAPVSAPSLREAVRMGAEVFHTLKKKLAEDGHSTGVGDEGGFAPKLRNSEEALEYIIQAVELAGFAPGSDIKIAMDVAAAEFYENGKYMFDGKAMAAEELSDVYGKWIDKYPIASLEDPFDQDAWQDWTDFTAKYGSRIQIMGDDLLVTNKERLEKAISEKTCNAILIKPNQIGTLSETREVIERAQEVSFGTVISHRSGETCDTTIADLAVALETRQIKTGSLSRSERTAKYNRMMKIESELAGSSTYQPPLK